MIGQHVVLFWIIQGNRVLQVCTGQGEVAQIKPADPNRTCALQEQCLVLDALRELEALLTQLQRRLIFRVG